MGEPAQWRQLARTILLTSAGILLFLGSFQPQRWPALIYNIGAVVLFSTLIGGPLQLVLPRLAPLIFRRASAPFNWLLLVVVMMAFAAAGSAAAIWILIGAGLFEASAFPALFANSIRASVAMTLTFGIGITLYERLRHRMDATELALRVKERDEAEARRLAAEAQLASLESRVQPHFLFNTLNSIAALIPSDPVGAERMTGQLASLLRSSLDAADRPLVPLGQELRTVRDYLEIERVRFGDRLRYSIEVPAAIEGHLVPRLALQTLVENSVKYAVTPRRDGGSVRLVAETNDSVVRLSVDDDGPGFALADAPSNHGLALLRERMTLLYGAHASLDVRRTSGRTEVVLTVPR